uniref:Uncharacterized protein n=1 Tax=Anguilla anguilla TaxID=7936 RepID=A0A0E9TKP3_ANGAN
MINNATGGIMRILCVTALQGS